MVGLQPSSSMSTGCMVPWCPCGEIEPFFATLAHATLALALPRWLWLWLCHAGSGSATLALALPRWLWLRLMLAECDQPEADQTPEWRENSLKVLFHSIRASGPPRAGRRIGLARAKDLSEGPFYSKQIRRTRDLGWLWSQSMGPNRCFRKWHDSLLITSKESQFTIQFFHYRLPLCPVQLHAVSWVDIVAKSNKFPFPMILVCDRKWVNIARYSVEDHLIGWWVGCRTHFVSGRKTAGRPRERPRQTRRRLFTPFLGVRRLSRGGWSEKAPLKYSAMAGNWTQPWLRIKPGPQGGQTVNHPTALSWLTESHD